MLSKDFLLARRLANLFASGPGGFHYYLLKWSDLRALDGGNVLTGERLLDVADYLLERHHLLAQSEEGIIVWHEAEVEPRVISEKTLHRALVLMSEEDEIAIEDEFIGALKKAADQQEPDEVGGGGEKDNKDVCSN